MDGVYDPAQEAVIEIDNGFKPLDTCQKDNFIFISCLGNTTSNISGQSWSLNSFATLSSFEYEYLQTLAYRFITNNEFSCIVW